MSNTLQHKRGTTAKRQAYTPLIGELVFDTDQKILYIGDGVTAGGIKVNAVDMVAEGLALLTGDNAFTGMNSYSGGISTTSPISTLADSSQVTAISTNFPAAVIAAWRNVNFSSYKIFGDNRTHFGVIAQDIQSTFTAASLNAADYGLIETINGILSVRLEECLILEAYCNRQSVSKADALTNARTISISGDATWSVSFNGTANASSALTLSNTGVTAGTYAKVTVDTKGRVTAGATLVAADIPALDTSKLSSGTLPVTRGGTGATSVTKGGIVYGSSTTAYSSTAAGTAGQYLVSNGANAPTWGNLDISGFAGSAVPKVAGTAAAGTSTNYARDDHVHPVQTSVSGNAGTATKLATGRTIALTGGVTGSVSFDGSANVSISTTVANLGVANGIATLDSTGKVPSTQLPSYVDDVLEYANVAAFPTTGEVGKIYVETTGNTTYRWSGSGYVKITSGEVSSVAGKTGVVTLTKSDVGLGNVDNTADSAKNVLSATKLTTARTINGVAFDGGANITIFDSTKAPLASPALTGVPTAPTAAASTNNTQLATTAFVQAVNTAETGASAYSLKWKTARKITVSGVVAGSVTIDGSANATLNTTFGDVDLGVL